MLRRRARAQIGGQPVDASAIRNAILLKERVAAGIATLLDPLIGRWFGAGSMVMVARRRI
jgi:hypothetical protein